MKIKLLYAVLATCLTLTACGTAPASESTASLPDTSQEEPVGTAPDESTIQDAPSQETEPTQGENTMKNIALGKVPDGYYSAATQQGKLENFTYDTTPIFYSEELKNDLMPALEAYYHTYAENTSDTGFEASRFHRAFGGFSAGGTTTWRVFLEGLDRFEFFLPMSGGLTLGCNACFHGLKEVEIT